jgi:hypothetical protein
MRNTSVLGETVGLKAANRKCPLTCAKWAYETAKAAQ